MDYIALLRGINVGSSVKINMKELKTLFEQCGFSNVSTYINSGNVIFQSHDAKNSITENIEQAIARAGSKVGNKGYDCALSAIEMVNLVDQL